MEEFQLAALCTNGDDIAGAYTVRRQIDPLSVDGEMPVCDILTGCIDGAGQPGTQDDGVEPAFKKLYHQVTGVASLALGLIVSGAKLTLADVVLEAQTLLLQQLLCVIAGLPSACVHTVLSGGMRLALEILFRLWSKREPETARQANLGSVIVHA